MSADARSFLLALLSLAFITGCATPFETYFKSAPPANLDPARFIDSKDAPAFAPYNDILEDDFRMIEYGYELIGFSQFNGPQKGNMEKKAIEYGSKIGAATVLYASQYDRTVSGVKTLAIPNADRTITSQTRGSVQARNDAGRTASGTYTETTTTSVPGGTTVYQQPYSIDRFSFLATYWKKIDVNRVFALGVRMRNLNTDEQRAIQNNGGVAVDVVMRDTPAFRSNVLVGDILTSIEDINIVSTEQFNQLLSQNRGKQVRIDLVRNGQKKTVSTRLN